jgi:hypothetical protein
MGLYEFKILSEQEQYSLLSTLEPVATRRDSDYLYEYIRLMTFM